MEKIAVITDSCADVPADIVEKYNIFVIPMMINCQDGEYRDGIDITAQDVYERLKSELPKTSSPAGEDVLDTFEKVKNQGYDKAVMIMLSSGLSGTYNQIKMMAEDEGGLEIEVFDSHEASLGNGAIVIQTAMYVAEGVGLAELKDKIKSLILNTKVFFSIDTLEFLQKGGRIGKVTAVAGAVLNIKPILSFHPDDGEIYTAAKVRGSKAVMKELIKLVSEAKSSGRRFNILVADGGASEQCDILEQKLKELYPDYTNLFRTKIGAALSVYLGDRLLGAGIQYLD